jgi:hypothetical protein
MQVIRSVPERGMAHIAFQIGSGDAELEELQ